MKKALLFLGGHLKKTDRLRKAIAKADIIVAADSGADNAFKMGLKPDHLVGDLDSVSKTAKSRIGNAAIHRYSTDKDLSDGELALKFLLSKHPTQIIVLGALGGKLDFTLSNLTFLASIPKSIPARVLDHRLEIFFARQGKVTFKGRKGDIVSVLPFAQSGAKLKTTGLKYRLKNEKLHFGSHGLSNIMTARQATISVTQGSVYIFHRFLS